MNQPPSTIACHGFCTDCGTTHSLPVGNSRQYAQELMEQLETHKRLNFPHPPRPSLHSGHPSRGGECLESPPPEGCPPQSAVAFGEDWKGEVGSNPESQIPNPAFSTSYLWGNARGQMFGVLECEDPAGNTVVLKAFSCQYNGEWLIDGWVPPLFDVDAFHQLTQPIYKEISELGRQIKKHPEQNELIEKRAALSRNLMMEIHDLYHLSNFTGETRLLSDLLGRRQGIPAGTGDCCAPKLLNYAALNGLKPVGLSEFYFGKESKSGERSHGTFYPACEEKCQPILGFMLCGAGEWSDGVREQWSTEKSNTPPLQHSMVIVYHDDDIVVICKPSGLLSVPGKGPENQDCVVARVKEQFPDCPDHPEVHRLDMDTSGLMVLARTKEAHRELSRQFHDRETQKRYIALLDACPADLSRRRSAKTEGLGGELPETSGTIKLPFRLDVDNRPVQIYDPVHGKLGITHWKTLAVENGKTRVEFIPITGRTHQLRVHAASEHGLGAPIVGDRLYGTGTAPGQLKLHAAFLSFTHPVTGKKLKFTSEPDF